VVHAFQGHGDDSIAVLRRALDVAPDFTPALNHLALVLKGRRRLDEAADLLRRAIAVAPAFAEAHINLGNLLLDQGRSDDALGCLREAARIAPSSALAHNSLGVALLAGDAVEDALESFRRAIAVEPNYAEAHGNLGRALRALGRAAEAEDVYRRAIAINPRYAEGHRRLGEMLLSAGRHEESAAHFRRVLALDSDDAGTEHKLGMALVQAPDAAARAEAPEHFIRAEVLARAAIAATPERPAAWETLGNALIRLGRAEEGFNARLRATSIVRNPDSRAFDHLPTFRRTSQGKLGHDIEQIRHLVERGALEREAGAALLTAYETVRNRLPAPAAGARLVELGADDRRLIGATYKRLWHVAPAPEIPGGAVNPSLDRAAIEADYFGRAPGITWLDGLLTPAALASLRRFCLESTIWLTDTYASGYIGSLGDDGFVCPLLLQIGRELPERLPGIFGRHPLLMMWAYKYGQQPAGIPIHADYAAINVNFWITPDDANLDPDSGGLIVWDKEAPADWGFQLHDIDRETLTRFVAETGAVAHRVSYRQNRAVIFNSDLIHRTDDIRFRPGYENRRINVTFLYGERTERS
jgi:tetratricopeptide (TPR) repeat protein